MKAAEVKNFVFNSENYRKAQEIIKLYPEGRQASATLPLLDIAQRQGGGYLTGGAIEYIAELLGLPHMRILEVASFYSMFNLKPIGKHHVQVCGTTPCWLRGAANIVSTCEKELGIKVGGTTADGMFTLSEVECLGACVNAPMVQINDDYYEDLDQTSMKNIIDHLKISKKVKVGSQRGRQCSSPAED